MALILNINRIHLLIFLLSEAGSACSAPATAVVANAVPLCEFYTIVRAIVYYCIL